MLPHKDRPRGSLNVSGTRRYDHTVLYRKKVGHGEIVYFTLGHRRGHYDMAPLMEYYPQAELGAWEVDPYMRILKNGLDWVSGGATS